MAASIALFPTQVQHAADNPSTIAGRLWDDTGAVVVEDGAAPIEDRRVAAAGVAGAPQEPPAAPSELLAYDDAVASATFLSWRDNASNETTYIVERSVLGLDGPWDALATVPTAEVCRVPPTTCWYFDYDIEQDGDYWYRVAAVNDVGQSAYSNPAQAGPQPGPQPQGQVRGVVFYDRDEDGMLDPTEEGLPHRTVLLKQDGERRESTSTGTDGTFTLEAAPGRYDLIVELDEQLGGCVDTLFSFDPLGGSFCVGVSLPWTATTADVIPVTVADEETVAINVGARPTDAAVIVGRVALETERAPSGARIEALVNDRVCGTSTVVADSEVDYVITVLGEREREGCASRGAIVSFRVGGVPATETASWVPYAEVANFLQIDFHNLTAMEHHAWYWMEVPAVGLPADGTPVQAMVGDTICGETVLRTSEGLPVYADPAIAGFSKLIVPSDELASGCGHDGATVTVRAGDTVIASMAWKPGLQAIDAAPPVMLPKTGSAGSDGRSLPWLWPVGLGMIGVLAVGAGALVRWQGKGRELRSRWRS
ncbi:MAG: fibronectin type III domain-containing protein [Chloroflexi bacterium]|nr:fibronectin type III domain-containing protein [Chloroflexota bacterium]